MTGHDTFREMSAAFVLGALDPQERRAFDAHLSGCAECRTEVANFAPIPQLLSRVGELDAVTLPDEVVDHAAAQARSEWRRLSHSRRSWRWVAAIAAVAATVMLVVAVLPANQDPGIQLVIQPSAVTGAVAIEGHGWGTSVHLDLGGLPYRDRYVVWVIDGAGNREQAATWGPTPAGIARVEGASSIPAAQVSTVVVSGPDGVEALMTASAG